MPLLSEPDRQTVQRHLSAITRPVTLLFFTQTFGAPDTVLQARQIVDELKDLNELVTIEEANFVLEKERAAQYGVRGIPAIVLLSNGEDTRMRFLGAPAGFEFMSLIEAIVIAGTGDSGLAAESRRKIAERVTSPLDVLVFVTPNCAYCPTAVTLANRMAAESPLIHATCVEATEFIDLTHRYRVSGVPKTVVNDAIEIVGALPEDAFIDQIVGGLQPAAPSQEPREQ